MTLTKSKVGDVLRVEVPSHGKYSEMLVVIAADTNGNWHTKVCLKVDYANTEIVVQDNMVFKMAKYSRIIDLPSEFNPIEVLKATQNFVDRNQTLYKKDEDIYHTILIDEGSLSGEEIQNLHPDIRAIVETMPVSRVKPLNVTVEQFRILQSGGRVVLNDMFALSTTDESTCGSHVCYEMPGF